MNDNSKVADFFRDFFSLRDLLCLSLSEHRSGMTENEPPLEMHWKKPIVTQPTARAANSVLNLPCRETRRSPGELLS